MAGSKNKKGKKEQDYDNNDMTRIEDLSQLIHRDDPEIEALFRKATDLPDLPLPQEEGQEEIEAEFQTEEIAEEILEETPPEEFVFTENIPLENEEVVFDSQFEETPFEAESIEADLPFEETSTEGIEENTDFFEAPEEIPMEEIVEPTPEYEEKISLQDIKEENIEFNNETSFGHQTFEANPAFSLKIENLDSQYVDDIIDILSDYDLIKNNNDKDFRESLKSGALLLSQQSEFLIIHLATRLKKYGGSMIMGPSDKIFSSRIMGTQSARGKVTKKIKDQSRKGAEILVAEDDQNPDDHFYFFMVGEPCELETLEDLGPIYATEVIDEDDLIRSSYAQKSLEQREKIQNDEIPLFEEYAEILDHKKEKLQKILKVKALGLEANTIINMQFLMNTQSVKKKTLLILTAEGRAIKTQSQQEQNTQDHEAENEL